jgi:hypothetical protein
MSKQRLKETYERIRATIDAFETWDGPQDLAGALAILVHTAFHLGQIRQSLCLLR